MRWLTSGESHGKAISAIFEGVPAGLLITADDINLEMKRRMLGYGRGGRMKIESDQIEILSGIRHGITIGSPIQLLIWNKDHENWLESMSVAPIENLKDKISVKRPRPGHADMAGLLKYRFEDARNILERASARETAMRVALGALAKKFLKEFGIEFGSHVTRLGSIELSEEEISVLRQEDINKIADASEARCLSKKRTLEMIQLVDRSRDEGDTLGGVCEVVVKGLPPGLGSHTHWDKKIDGKLSAALMSIQAIKGVEIGLGFKLTKLPGSAVHDELGIVNEKIQRYSNNAGGIEGGMTNGEDLVMRVGMKPLSTLKKSLRSVNLDTKSDESAHFERSDVEAVGACGVVAESGAAMILMEAFLEKFGSDSCDEIKDNYNRYMEYVNSKLSK